MNQLPQEKTFTFPKNAKRSIEELRENYSMKIPLLNPITLRIMARVSEFTIMRIMVRPEGKILVEPEQKEDYNFRNNYWQLTRNDEKLSFYFEFKDLGNNSNFECDTLLFDIENNSIDIDLSIIVEQK